MMSCFSGGSHALSPAPGINAKRLAIICAGAVLCGELSLMAAQTNPGELMRSHVAMERHGIIEKSTV